MKKYNVIFSIVIGIFVIILIIGNICVINSNNKNDNSKPYKVEVNRICHDIENNGFENINLNKYLYVFNVEQFSNNNNDFYNSSSDCIIKEIDNNLYRFDYKYSKNNNNTLLIMNICIIAITIITIFIMVFIKVKIIKPFNYLRDIPYELAKGNLAIPIKENKGRYFGRFAWGIDLLREHLEEQKNNALKLQKEKKTLLMSISHDIKTPLSIIELYSKALEKNIYKDEDKQKQIFINISEKCTEIKKYVNDIIKSSSNDFLKLEVNVSEFYLSDLVKQLENFYIERLALLKIDFKILSYNNCIINGDIDRSIEILQNIIENAIKYGDGKNISISFEYDEDCVLVSINNSGCTLNENELPHIFDSFWRGSNVGSNKGNGLGLYICYQLIHKMDGDIFAYIKNNCMCVTVVFRLT